MSTLPKEILRQMIKENVLKTVGDIHSFLKDLFKDSLQFRIYFFGI